MLGVALVGRLPRDAERLGDLRPRPAIRYGSIDRREFEAIGQPPQGDHRSQRVGGIVGNRQVSQCGHASTVVDNGRIRQPKLTPHRSPCSTRRLKAVRLLLTNDDGIEAEGLHALRDALLKIPGVDVMVIAPDGNRSATGRSITTRRPIVSRHVTFADGGEGWAIDGTPVDCVRLGWYELAGARPEMIVAGINHGANLGDDITYSGTVGAALEGHHLGLPGLAVSQIARDAGLGFTDEGGYDFTGVAAFAAQLVQRRNEVGLEKGTVLNVNAPAGDPSHAELTRLGRRVYKDGLRRIVGDAPERAARHGAAEPVVTYGNAERIAVYGVAASHEDEPGTDLHAVARGHISVTPVSLRWTDLSRLEGLHSTAIDDALAHSGAHLVSDAEAAEEAHGRTGPAGPLVQGASPAHPEVGAHSVKATGEAE